MLQTIKSASLRFIHVARRAYTLLYMLVLRWVGFEPKLLAKQWGSGLIDMRNFLPIFLIYYEHKIIPIIISLEENDLEG